MKEALKKEAVEKEALLILAHGSRRDETEKILTTIVEKVKKRTGMELVMPAYLQFSGQSLEVGVRMLVEQGASRISVVPMFLFDGIHVTQDIPEEIRRIKERYPGVEIRMAQHIGADDRIVGIIIDRAREN